MLLYYIQLSVCLTASHVPSLLGAGLLVVCVNWRSHNGPAYCNKGLTYQHGRPHNRRFTIIVGPVNYLQGILSSPPYPHSFSHCICTSRLHINHDGTHQDEDVVVSVGIWCVYWDLLLCVLGSVLYTVLYIGISCVFWDMFCVLGSIWFILFILTIFERERDTVSLVQVTPP